MNTIDIRAFDIPVFLRYLGENLKNQPKANDLSRFFVQTLHEDKDCLLTPGFGDFHWTHDNENFLVTFKEEGVARATAGGMDYYLRLQVHHPNLDLLSAFVKHALTYNKPLENQKIKVYYSRSKGYWDYFSSVYAQHLESIYVEPETKNSILQHIESFIKNKERYVKFGRSYKLNFLFTGVPGSGKTSLIKAIALKYNRPLYVLNFSKTLVDENLVSLMAEVRENSIILMEDIDSFFVDRESKDNEISFSALLNIMDGTMSQGNGTMMFLTANNPDRLDPALIRPGRIDRVVKFDFPRRQEIELAFRDITETEDQDKFNAFYKHIKNVRINMSAIIDYLFRYPTLYLENIQELLSQTQLRHEIVNDKTDKMYN
jgi:hypothetical protein